MRRSLNKVLLQGNLTADPEAIATKTGRPMSTFSVATNLSWTSKDGKQVAETDFHRIVAFGKLGEIVKTYLHKGIPIIVSGRLRNRSYEGKDGAKKYISEVILDDFNFVSGGKKEKTAVAA